jgi:hypothetical protein
MPESSVRLPAPRRNAFPPSLSRQAKNYRSVDNPLYRKRAASFASIAPSGGVFYRFGRRRCLPGTRQHLGMIGGYR